MIGGIGVQSMLAFSTPGEIKLETKRLICELVRMEDTLLLIQRHSIRNQLRM